jgi:anti-sigma regulatory factor (Ser/Thr protein kinase)/biotin operon repressor
MENEGIDRPASAMSNVAETPRHRRVRARGEEIRGFILTNMEKSSGDIARSVGERFGISRQAVNKHLKHLVAEGALVPEGKTRYRRYKLAALLEWKKLYFLGPGIDEDIVWSRDVSLVLGNLPKNVMEIWHFCITEMFNNAIDHSGAETVFIKVAKTAANTQIMLMDDGIGIFKKIQAAMNLADERHAILELAKGKLTTDPKGHTGQGIFFTSRVLDSFDILSSGVFFTHTFGFEEDWILERPESTEGTTVFMKLNNHSARTDKQIFDQYSSGEDYGFTKTVVPVRLAQYGDDKLISRSQAKRLLARVDRFKTVLFDFKAVETVGQAFADEIFRVFAQGHPNIEIVPINATPQVQQMIHAARTDVGGV